MKYLKKLYGKTVIDNSDSEELPRNEKIELEYYQISSKTSNKPYGIEIIKKKLKDDIMNIEEKIIRNICFKEQDSISLLGLLMKNKVTPILVDDVIEDLSKMKVI